MPISSQAQQRCYWSPRVGCKQCKACEASSLDICSKQCEASSACAVPVGLYKSNWTIMGNLGNNCSSCVCKGSGQPRQEDICYEQLGYDVRPESARSRVRVHVSVQHVHVWHAAHACVTCACACMQAVCL